MSQALDIISGVSWTLTYIAAIVLGIKGRTWCIPKLAICMSFSWELLVVTSRFQNGAIGDIPFYVQLTWLLLDIGILMTWLIYDSGKSKLAKNLCLLSVVFLIMFAWGHRGEAWELTAFIDNVIMSALFIYRTTKDHTPWASRFISVTKLIGTLSATLLVGLISTNPLILWIGGLCFLLDMYYIAILFSNDFSQ